MKNFLRFLTFVGLVVVVLAPAQRASAGIIGDTITITRLYPDLLTLYDAPSDGVPATVSTTALVGPGDAISPQPSLYLIDLEANNIFFDFLSPSAFGGAVPGVFDGLQFLGFSQAIQNVTVVDATGISVAELAFGPSFINLDLDGAFTGDSSLNLSVEFSPVGVPEPATLALFGAGLAGLAIIRRRRKAKA